MDPNGHLDILQAMPRKPAGTAAAMLGRLAAAARKHVENPGLLGYNWQYVETFAHCIVLARSAMALKHLRQAALESPPPWRCVQRIEFLVVL